MEQRKIWVGLLPRRPLRRVRLSVEVAGYFGRPGIFALTVDRHRCPPVTLED